MKLRHCATRPVARGTAAASLCHRRLRTVPWPAMLLMLGAGPKSPVSKDVLQLLAICFLILAVLIDRMNVVAVFALEKVGF